MIKASELRIGNYISDDDGVLAKVIGFAPFDHSIRCDEEEGCKLLIDCYHTNGSRRSGCETDSPECDPIPLTPEWLERFGFEKKMFTYPGDPKTESVEAYVKGRFVIRWIDIGTNASYKAEWFPWPQSHNLLPGDINYVHQLQNNYYYWTNGEELAITQLVM